MVRRGLASSRAQAKRLIISQQVVIVGGTAIRPSSVVASQTVIEVIGGQRRWVSRGAEKLLAALDAFPVELQGKTVLDVGASTGGFTEVALEAGAAKVVALDVGRGQLHERLSADPRVVSLEKTNIREVSPKQVGGPFPVVVVDLSFISLRVVAGSLAAVAADDADLIVLIKPQFEVGRAGLGHGGIVRDPDHPGPGGNGCRRRADRCRIGGPRPDSLTDRWRGWERRIPTLASQRGTG